MQAFGLDDRGLPNGHKSIQIPVSIFGDPGFAMSEKKFKSQCLDKILGPSCLASGGGAPLSSWEILHGA